ncbi:hypothetical protein [Azotobacter armeniacus]
MEELRAKAKYQLAARPPGLFHPAAEGVHQLADLGRVVAEDAQLLAFSG